MLTHPVHNNIECSTASPGGCVNEWHRWLASGLKASWTGGRRRPIDREAVKNSGGCQEVESCKSEVIRLGSHEGVGRIAGTQSD